MRKAPKFVLVLVTAPNRRVARRLATLALKSRLVACANLLPGVESHYWWQDRLETGREVLIVFKTTATAARRLERVILEAHPYETPEFIVVPINAGSPRYLDWITANTRVP
ncbi:MAG TPA: divalent-cation tolerance protein CutA [Methylomirabilota bacterium]|nr:divalent-cation tolerance protein CutA [Methylomirabilota bacterium]